MQFAEQTQCMADLTVVGLRFTAMTEGCKCGPCRQLDLRHDVDALATRAGKPVFVQWHSQRRFHYPTVVVRLSSDNGSSNVQAAKLLSGRSLADYHVSGYECHVAYVEKESLIRALRQMALIPCRQHPVDVDNGGQCLTAFCPSCCPGVKVLGRPGTSCNYLPWPGHVWPYPGPEAYR